MSSTCCTYASGMFCSRFIWVYDVCSGVCRFYLPSNNFLVTWFPENGSWFSGNWFHECTKTLSILILTSLEHFFLLQEIFKITPEVNVHNHYQQLWSHHSACKILKPHLFSRGNPQRKASAQYSAKCDLACITKQPCPKFHPVFSHHIEKPKN